MDTIILVREALGLNKRTMDADLAEIARRWEMLMEGIYDNQTSLEYTRRQAFTVIIGLSVAYLRGHGFRLGNYKSFNANSFILSCLSTCVIVKVEEKGEIFFPIINKLGLGSLEQVLKTYGGVPSSKGILEQAEEILRAKRQDN